MLMPNQQRNQRHDFQSASGTVQSASGTGRWSAYFGAGRGGAFEKLRGGIAFALVAGICADPLLVTAAFAAPPVKRAASKALPEPSAAGAAQPANADSPRRQVAVLGSAQVLRRPFTIIARDSRLEARGREALSLLKFNAAEVLPGWTISFRPSNDRLLGLTKVPESRIEIYFRSGRSVEAVAHDLAHELGHAVDVTYGSSDMRSAFLKFRGLSADTPWWSCNKCNDLDVGAGDFAEVFSQLIGPRGVFYSRLAPRPTGEELAVLVEKLPSEVRAGLPTPAQNP